MLHFYAGLSHKAKQCSVRGDRTHVSRSSYCSLSGCCVVSTVVRIFLVLVHVTLSTAYEICIIITFTDKEAEAKLAGLLKVTQFSDEADDQTRATWSRGYAHIYTADRKIKCVCICLQPTV